MWWETVKKLQYLCIRLNFISYGTSISLHLHSQSKQLSDHDVQISLQIALKNRGQIFETFLRHFPKIFLCQMI